MFPPTFPAQSEDDTLVRFGNAILTDQLTRTSRMPP